MSVDALMGSVEAAQADPLTKYDPQQSRVPAGSGRESGRWAAESQSSAVSATPAVAGAAALRAAPLLAPELGGLALAALSAFAASVGAAAVLGVLFVPSPSTVSSSGLLPGNSGATYDYNHDEGLLRVLNPSGEVLAAGHKDASGVFFDAALVCRLLARCGGGALVFDGAAMAAPKGRDDAGVVPGAVPWTGTNDDQPKLCPEPGPDQPGSMRRPSGLRNIRSRSAG